MNVFTREYNYLHVEVYRVLNPSQNLIRITTLQILLNSVIAVPSHEIDFSNPVNSCRRQAAEERSNKYNGPLFILLRQ